jgi:uncharacterized damage-inducible protein DinB
VATLSSDPLDILLAHDAWGTRGMLRLCEPLSEEQFHRRFPIGMGSLHDNIAHTIAAMRRWADRIAERTLRESIFPMPWAKPQPATRPRFAIPELVNLLEEAAADLRGVAAHSRSRAGGLGSTITVPWPTPDGKTTTYTFTRAAALTHLCTHNHYHRAQCMNMLRHLNVPGLSDKLPDLSVIDWQAETESPPTIA